MTRPAVGQVGRTFLVGCPRSGTTLLQSLLFAHPDVLSFPETFFFVKAINGDGSRHRLGLASADAARAFDTLVRLGIMDQRPRAAALPASERATARRFARSLDAATIDAGRQTWVEKTPSHLYRVETIARHVPRARFIHMVRAGAPTVASLYDVTQRYADWDGERDLDACARRWIRDIALSCEHAGRPDHAFVSYERLAEDPETVMASLCRFLELRADAPTIATMFDGFEDRAADVTVDEPWKRATGGVVTNRNATKAAAVLDESERVRLDELLEHAEHDRRELPFL